MNRFINEANYLASLFNGLNSRDISYAVLRNYQSLPHNLGGSDVDIWVNPSHKEDFYQVLEDVARENAGYLVSYTADSLCPRIIYQGKDWGIQLDVHLGVAIHHGVPYMSDDIIKENITTHNDIKVLKEDCDGLIGFFKEILNNKKCRLDYCERASALVSAMTEQQRVYYMKAFSESAQKMLLDVLLNKKFEKDEIRRLGEYCSKDLVSSCSNLKYRIGQFSKLSRLFHQPGYTIAVLGTDGSGKSFIINSITPILNEAFHNGVRYEHMRPNYFSSLAVATGRKKTDTHEVCSNPHGSKPSGLIGSIARLTYYWLDYTYGYFRKVFLDKTFRTHLWIFDRYYYDYLLDQRRARLNMPEWIIKLYGIFVPRPDLTLCLGGDPEKIYARKPETSLEEVTRQTVVLQQFCKNHKNAVWVDTTLKPEQSIDAAMTAILGMLSKRFAKTKLK